MEKLKEEIPKCQKENTATNKTNQPSGAFIGASWAGLIIGMGAFLIGLWNIEATLNEKGFYLAILLMGLFSVISVQKSVRDKMEGIPITPIYFGLSWFMTTFSMVLLIIGLWNADFEMSDKGFFAMSFVLSLFASVAIQKNTRDILNLK
jgi:uncharacterized membrane protein YiaA